MRVENVGLAFLLTFIAGISTGIGSIIAFFSKGFNPDFLSGSLGFSAGVMIYISFVEIFSKANDIFLENMGIRTAYLLTIVSFFAGILFIAIIDKIVPKYENPHEVRNIRIKNDESLKRLGIFSAIAITIHNFPEGFATFIGALTSLKLGLGIAIAIAIHNIPEGIAVSFPIYYSTKSKIKAFWLSLLSGISEPIGALIGFFILRNLLNGILSGIVFGIVAGIMVYISLDELLPTAEEYGKHHIAISGLIIGMFVMALSIFLFKTN